MKPAITEMEYIAPAPLKKGYQTPWYVWAALIGTVLATIISLFPIPVEQSHAQMKQLTDRQQEQFYCSQWAAQKVLVSGGTTDAIRNHCNKYL